MNKNFYSRIVFCVLFSVLFLNRSQAANNLNKKPKYVFYFIGDGMGLNQTSVTEAYLSALEGEIGFKKLHMSTLPVVGLSYTHSRTRLITGSAAAGTALASGEKTAISHLGMDKLDSTIKFKTIAEKALERGMKIGIITNVQLNHATPAAFYSKASKRSAYDVITPYMAESGFNFFAGGSIPKTSNNIGNDSAYVALLKDKGYKIVEGKGQFNDLKSGDKVIVTSLTDKMFDGQSVNYSIDRNNDTTPLNLVDFTRKGIELLKDNAAGFLMIAEGGKIDWASHSNDVVTTIHEVIEFDNTIKLALDFYNKHPDETLIVICSDHETGGLAMGVNAMKYDSDLSLLKDQKMSSWEFGDKIIEPYYLRAGNSAKLSEVLPLIEEYIGGIDSKQMIALFNSDSTTIELESLRNAHDLYLKHLNNTLSNYEAVLYYQFYNEYNPIAVTATKILANKAGLAWTTYYHTAIPTLVRAIGSGSEIFDGMYDNTDIPKKMEKLMGLGE